MLDKSSKALLEFMNGIPSKTIDYISDFQWPPSVGDEDEFLALVRFLEEKGYLESIKTQMGHSVGTRLSHKGLHWKEFRRQEILLYFEDKWIDFFALLVSIAAIILSVISLAAQSAALPAG